MANHNPPVNGLDKRKEHINRKGRPKSFDALRALAQQLAHEAVDTQQGKMTAVEIILRQMAKDPKQRALFLEYAFGKVPQAVDVTSGGRSFVIDYSIFNMDELTRIKSGESESVVYADALQRLATSAGNRRD